jgi:hypothetical protein
MKSLVALLAAASCLAAAPERPTEESFVPNYNAANLYYLWGSEADLEAVPGAGMSLHEAGMLAQVPVWRNEANRLTVGVRYRWNQLDFSEATPFGAGALDLHRLQLPVNYWHAFGDHWKLWAGVEPGVFTDFEKVSGDDLAVTALVVAAWEFHPEWSLSFGAYYSRDLGEDRALPVLGVIWRPSVHWNISATFPRCRVAYAPNETWLFEAIARPGGSAWSIRTDDGQDRNLEYKSWRASLGVERLLGRSFGGKWFGFIEGGVGFGQDLKLTDDGDELFGSDLGEILTLSGGVRLRY